MSSPLYEELALNPALKQVRIITLLPGEWGDAISCKLRVVSLNARPQFEAISYVWGNFLDLRTVLINEEHELEITANLDSALRHFRLQNESRELWADAISMDQSSESERNQQIPLMRSIYRQCSEVLIWLGSHTGVSNQPYEWSSDFTKESLNDEDDLKNRKYVADFGRYYQRPRAARFMMSQDPEEGVFCMISLLAIGNHFQGERAIPFLHAHLTRRKIMEALKNIMEQPWWRRQWVIQETVLAPKATIHYGRFKCPWEMFTLAARQYVKHRKGCCSAHYAQLPPEEVDSLAYFARTIRDIDDWRVLWQNPTSRISLLPLLWQFRSRSTSNAKDKVYALLPLVNEFGQADVLVPRYDWPVEDIYRDVVVNMIDVYKRLLVLVGNTEKSNAYKTLPSWVPDWTVPRRPKELERLQRVMIYNADRGNSPDQRFLGSSYLELNGIRHDVVSDFTDVMPSSEDEEISGRVFKDWWDFLKLNEQKSKKYPFGGSLLEAYWSTLCMDTKYVG